MRPIQKFDVGEQVVCLHKGQPYPAKIVSVNDDDERMPHYNVHYIGWNTVHDEKILFSRQDERLHKCTVQEYRRKHNMPEKPERAAPIIIDEDDEKPKPRHSRLVCYEQQYFTPIFEIDQGIMGRLEPCLSFCNATVHDIRKIHGVKTYVIRFINQDRKYDQYIPVGDENGKMFHGCVEEINNPKPWLERPTYGSEWIPEPKSVISSPSCYDRTARSEPSTSTPQRIHQIVGSLRDAAHPGASPALIKFESDDEFEINTPPRSPPVVKRPETVIRTSYSSAARKEQARKAKHEKSKRSVR